VLVLVRDARPLTRPTCLGNDVLPRFEVVFTVRIDGKVAEAVRRRTADGRSATSCSATAIRAT
jgi:hypothetical protein